jgi:hypothetical protein
MTPMRRVWRVEHKTNGAGPFVDQTVWRERCKHGKNPQRMPGPYSATHKRGPLSARFDSNYRYAFDSLQTLAKWTCECHRQAAHKAGYVVRVYGVSWDSHTLLADQVVFRKTDAIPLRELSLLEVPVELEVCQLRQMASCISSTKKQSTSAESPGCPGLGSEYTSEGCSIPISKLPTCPGGIDGGLRGAGLVPSLWCNA